MWLQQFEKSYIYKLPANGTLSERFYFYRGNLKNVPLKNRLCYKKIYTFPNEE